MSNDRPPADATQVIRPRNPSVWSSFWLPLLLVLCVVTLGGASVYFMRSAEDGLQANRDQESVKSTAAFEHGCPFERVRIVQAVVLRPGFEPEAFVLDVCGKTRRYRRSYGGYSAHTVFVDVTDKLLSPETQSTQPAPKGTYE